MISELPSHLSERTRLVASADGKSSGAFVLYWMCTAVRSEENPALDVACNFARKLDTPLLVYHGLSDDYKFASDRHHSFIIDGARDVQSALKDQGVSYAFHLATRDDRRSHLLDLASRAAVVVTEDMPVDPARRYLQVLRRRVQAPIYCVDTTCVVPMQLTTQAFTRAFQFRDATERLRSERLPRAWPATDALPRQFDLDSLPFAPVDLSRRKTSDLVARCDIDHSIGPVVDTPGGTAAAYRRWEAFKATGLRSYANRRNDALANGVSRMSAYLHYGMVSPMRLAREAHSFGGPGATKYLDELLIWRELAYNFCFYRADHADWEAIPSWAQETLNKHLGDARPALYSWEQLSRGETDDPLWNAAQKSLLMHGELHNNVRMTWGKAFVKWQKTPQQALAMMIDLNHRYALDGRDPSSYGGLLWCLGQFDRPFEPEQKIMGRVRSRTTQSHAERIDATKYARLISKPRFAGSGRVAIVGAGISGLTAARVLGDHGLSVTVFEKSRGPGGRMATRRSDRGATFDHGAQYFTARDQRFRRYVDSWIEQGIAAAWPKQIDDPEQRIVSLRDGEIESISKNQPRYVAVPTMNAICKHIAAGLNVRCETHVARATYDNESIQLLDAEGQSLGEFEQLVVSTPAAQARVILDSFPELKKQLDGISMRPCWAGMFHFSQPLTSQWAGAFLHDSFLSWAARNNTKPGRIAEAESLVVHASPEWTADHLEKGADEVAVAMLEEFWRVSGARPQVPTGSAGHRWLYAIPKGDCSSGCFFDAKARVAACGDWAAGSRIEGAFLSGMAAAGQLLGTLTAAPDSQPKQLALF